MATNQNLASVNLAEAFKPDGLTSTTDEFDPGMLVHAEGGVYMRVQADEDIDANQVVVVEADYGVQPAKADDAGSTANAGGSAFVGKPVAVAVCDIPSGCFAWVCVYGQTTIDVAGAAGSFVQLSATDTAGALDDATTTGDEKIDGIVLTANATAAGTATAWVNFPSVGTTN